MARAWAAAALVGLAAACGTGRTVWIVDRIEGRSAVLIDDHGEVRAVPLCVLPGGVAEGEALVDDRRDEEESKWRRRECAARRAERTRSDDGADFSLEEAP